MIIARSGEDWKHNAIYWTIGKCRRFLAQLENKSQLAHAFQ